MDTKQNPADSGEKHPGGRPEKYDPSYCQLMVNYFDKEKSKQIIKKIPLKKGGVVEMPETIANPLPQFSKFAREVLKVSKQTLLNWTEKHPEFLDAYNMCKEIQKEFIIDNGLSGLYHPKFCQFVAVNVTDMKNKAELDSSVTGKMEHEVTQITRKIVKPPDKK